MPSFRARRRGVSWSTDLHRHTCGARRLQRPPSHPNRHSHAGLALVNWHPSPGLEPSPLYTSPAFFFLMSRNTHAHALYPCALIHTVFQARFRTSGSAEARFTSSFLLFGVFFLHPFVSYSFYRSKAIWLKPAPPVRHQTLLHKPSGMSNLSLMS